MNINSLPVVVSLLVALSVSTERVVEIIKSFSVYLTAPKTDPHQEAHRQAAIQALAVVAGIAVSVIAWPISSQVVAGETRAGQGATIVALGFLASGGSGFWNSILGYVTNLKTLQEAALTAATTGGIRPIPNPTEGKLTL